MFRSQHAGYSSLTLVGTSRVGHPCRVPRTYSSQIISPRCHIYTHSTRFVYESCQLVGHGTSGYQTYCSGVDNVRQTHVRAHTYSTRRTTVRVLVACTPCTKGRSRCPTFSTPGSRTSGKKHARRDGTARGTQSSRSTTHCSTRTCDTFSRLLPFKAISSRPDRCGQHAEQPTILTSFLVCLSVPSDLVRRST